MRVGVVTQFDPLVGLGQIRDDTGSMLGFHCIAISDGTRTIEVGARVRFELLAKLGRYEATAISAA